MASANDVEVKRVNAAPSTIFQPISHSDIVRTTRSGLGIPVSKKARLLVARSVPTFPRKQSMFKNGSTQHWFGGLSAEVVTEILKYLPLDSLVAVGQLNKTAREFLSGTGLIKSIWERARKSFKPPLKVAPTTLLDHGRWGIASSELTWARWLLGQCTATCVFCRHATREPPICISLNIYICVRSECRLHWKRQFIRSNFPVSSRIANDTSIHAGNAPPEAITYLPDIRDEDDIIIHEVLERHVEAKLEQARFEDARLPLYSLSEDIKETRPLYPFILQHSMLVLLCRRPHDEQAIVLCEMLEQMAGVGEEDLIMGQARHLRLLSLSRLRKTRGVKTCKRALPFEPLLGEVDSVCWPDEEIQTLVCDGMVCVETSPFEGFGSPYVYSRALYRLEDLRKVAIDWSSADSPEKEELRKVWREKAETLNARMLAARKLRTWLIDRNILWLRVVRRGNENFLKERIEELGLSWIDASNSPTLCQIRRLSEIARKPVYSTRPLDLSTVLGPIPDNLMNGTALGIPQYAPAGTRAVFKAYPKSTKHLPRDVIGRFGSIRLLNDAVVGSDHSPCYLSANTVAPVGPWIRGLPLVVAVSAFSATNNRLATTYVDLADFDEVKTNDWVENAETIKAEIRRLAKRRRDREQERALLDHRNLRLAFYEFCKRKGIPDLPSFRVFSTLRASSFPVLSSSPIECSFDDYLPLILEDLKLWNDDIRSVLTARVHQGRFSWTELPVLDWACSLFRCAHCDMKAEASAKCQRDRALSSRSNAETTAPMKTYKPVYRAPMSYAESVQHNCEGEWNLDTITLHSFAKEVVIAAGWLYGLSPDATRKSDLLQLGSAWICEVEDCDMPVNIEELVQHLEEHSHRLHSSGPEVRALLSSLFKCHPGARPPPLTDLPTMSHDICTRLIGATPAERNATSVCCGRCLIASGGEPKIFTLDGLRDHLKQKHKVQAVAIEDVVMATNGLAMLSL